MAIELLTPFTKVELEPEIKDKKRKQVGILGGNFNPVHNAHLIVACLLLAKWVATRTRTILLYIRRGYYQRVVFTMLPTD